MKYNKIVQHNNITPEHIAGEIPNLAQAPAEVTNA